METKPLVFFFVSVFVFLVGGIKLDAFEFSMVLFCWGKILPRKLQRVKFGARWIGVME